MLNLISASKTAPIEISRELITFIKIELRNMKPIRIIAWVVTGLFGLIFIISWLNAFEIQTRYGSLGTVAPWVIGRFAACATLPIILWAIILIAKWVNSSKSGEKPFFNNKVVKTPYNNPIKTYEKSDDKILNKINELEKLKNSVIELKNQLVYTDEQASNKINEIENSIRLLNIELEVSKDKKLLDENYEKAKANLDKLKSAGLLTESEYIQSIEKLRPNQKEPVMPPTINETKKVHSEMVEFKNNTIVAKNQSKKNYWVPIIALGILGIIIVIIILFSVPFNPGQNDAEKAATEYLKALMNKDFDKAKTLATKETAQNLDMMKSLGTDFGLTEVQDVRCVVYENSASCTFCCTKDTSFKELKLKKEGGAWLAHQPKETPPAVDSSKMKKEVEFYNWNKQEVSLAIAFFDDKNDCWISEGWYIIKADDTFNYKLGEYNGKSIFWYASLPDGSYYVGKDAYFCVHPRGDKFEYNNNEKCNSKKGFIEAKLEGEITNVHLNK